MEGLEESMAFVQQRMQSVMSNFASPDDMGKVLGTPAAAKELPKSEQVWIVALHTEHVADGWTESMAVCRLVEQEKPSSELGVIMEQLKGITTEDSLRLLFEAVVSSCNKPMLYGQQPCRPKHVLLLVESEAKALKKRFKSELGISTGTARRYLATPMRIQLVAEFERGKNVSDQSTHDSFNPTPPTPMDPFGLGMKDTLRSHIAAAEGEVSEKRVPMRGWKPPSDDPPGIPFSWYARPPPSNGADYRANQLWGWRTNLRNAAVKGDADRLRTLTLRQDKHEVCEFCEMTRLLTSSAQKGMMEVCQVLIEEAGVAVNGVRAVTNQAKWRNCQISSGDNRSASGNTPLMFVSESGNLPLLKYLIAQGGDPDIGNMDEKYPIHVAIFHQHKDVVLFLIKSGTNLSQRDATGMTPHEFAMALYDQFGGSKSGKSGMYLRIAKLLAPTGEDGAPAGLSRPLNTCAVCDEPSCSMKCPCGTVYYCGGACQKQHWKLHKTDHKASLGAAKSKT